MPKIETPTFHNPNKEKYLKGGLYYEKIKESKRKWRAKHPRANAEAHKRWRKNNPKEYNEWAESAKFKHHLLRMEVVEKLGGKCIICGFSDWRVLQIDHIEGGGNKEKKQFKSTYSFYKYILSLSDEEAKKKYQMLCANCNWIKRFENREMYKKKLINDNT